MEATTRQPAREGPYELRLSLFADGRIQWAVLGPLLVLVALGGIVEALSQPARQNASLGFAFIVGFNGTLAVAVGLLCLRHFLSVIELSHACVTVRSAWWTRTFSWDEIDRITFEEPTGIRRVSPARPVITIRTSGGADIQLPTFPKGGLWRPWIHQSPTADKVLRVLQGELRRRGTTGR